MTRKKVDLSLEALEKRVDELVQEELCDLDDEELLRDRVKAIVNGHIEATVMGHLGLERRWGRWEIDKSRLDRSPLGNRIREMVPKLVDEWCAETGGAIPPMTAAEKKELLREFRDQLHATAYDKLAEQADHLADARLREALGDNYTEITRGGG